MQKWEITSGLLSLSFGALHANAIDIAILYVHVSLSHTREFVTAKSAEPVLVTDVRLFSASDILYYRGTCGLPFLLFFISQMLLARGLHWPGGLGPKIK